MMTDEKFMRLAIKKAEEGMKEGQTPFGACIVRKGRVVNSAHNKVWEDTDITAHAEMTAIREACRKLKTVDLSDCTIYSTTEPCPMCFAAIHWAKIGKIVYGTKVQDAQKAGFSELPISNIQMKKLGKSKVNIKAGFLRKEALEVFRDWYHQKTRRTY